MRVGACRCVSVCANSVALFPTRPTVNTHAIDLILTNYQRMSVCVGVRRSVSVCVRDWLGARLVAATAVHRDLRHAITCSCAC